MQVSLDQEINRKREAARNLFTVVGETNVKVLYFSKLFHVLLMF